MRYYEDNIYIGRHSYFSGPPQRLEYNDTNSQVIIGDYTSIAQDVTFMAGGNHHIDRATTYPIITRMIPSRPPLSEMPVVSDNIIIGNDVWIGREAKIVGPRIIGDGAIIGAYSVVTKDVPPYALVAGNPARIKKFRYSKGVIQAMCRIAWWNWSDEEVKERADDLLFMNIAAFVDKYDIKDNK